MARSSLIGTLALVSLMGCQAAGGPPTPSTDGEELAKQCEAPKNPKPDFVTGDQVAILQDDGSLDLECQVLSPRSKIVFAPVKQRGQEFASEWQPAAGPNGAVDGYQVRDGNGRLARNLWVPAPQIFPVPWGAHRKVGDKVVQRRQGDFPNYAGAVTGSNPDFTSYSVRLEGESKDITLAAQDCFATIEPAQGDRLQPGQVVYFQKMHFAMVMEKQKARVAIRQSGVDVKDRLVEISTLQELR